MEIKACCEYCIHFWHGYCHKNQTLAKALDKPCGAFEQEVKK